MNMPESILSEEFAEFMSEWRRPSEMIEAHSSGSTGAPKTILLKKSDMRASAEATNKRFGIGSDSALLCPLSASYIAGKMMAVRADEAGCRLITETPSNRPYTQDYGVVDLMAIVPSMVESLCRNQNAARGLRNVIVGGAPLSPAQEAMLASAPWKSYATYGMTETCSHVALRSIGSDLYEAMPGVNFAVDSRGCLIVNASHLSVGTLITNDLVDLISPTQFRWLGRLDNVINSGGIKLFPEQIERKLAPHIRYPFLIQPMMHPKWGEAVELMVEAPSDTLELNQPEFSANIAGICQQVLSKYEQPKNILIVNSLPRTANGKIRRRTLNK